MTTTELHGEIVTWDTKSKDVPITTIRNALAKAGLPDVARDLNNRSAFQRALGELRENRSIDKVNSDRNGKVVFQLTKKELRDDKYMEFDFEALVTLDTLSGDISCNDQNIETMARNLFAHAMNHRNASDITRMVQKLFKGNADLFPINPARGVAYFVPQIHSEFTARVEQFLNDVGGSVGRFPVPKGTEHGNRSVREAVDKGLHAIIDELDSASLEWSEATRDDTINRALDKFEAVQYKASLYATLLESRHSELVNHIAEAGKRLLERAEGVRASDEQVV